MQTPFKSNDVHLTTGNPTIISVLIYNMGHPYFIGHVVSTRPQVTYCAPDDSLKDHERFAVIL